MLAQMLHGQSRSITSWLTLQNTNTTIGAICISTNIGPNSLTSCASPSVTAHLTEKTLTNVGTHTWRHSIQPRTRRLGSKQHGDGIGAVGGCLVRLVTVAAASHGAWAHGEGPHQYK